MTSSNEPPLTRRELRERERLREQQAASSTPDTAPPSFAAPQAAAASGPAAPVRQPSVPVQQPSVVPPAPQSASPQFAAPVAAAQVAQNPGYAPPRPAGGFEAPTAAPQAPTSPPQQSPFAPRPDTPSPAQPAVAPQPAVVSQPQAPARPQVAAPVSAVPATPVSAVPAAPVSAIPAASAELAPTATPVAGQTPERTLTRRELRAMLEGSALDDLDDELDEVAPSATGSAGAAPPAAAQIVNPQTGQPFGAPAAASQSAPLHLPGDQPAMPASLATPLAESPPAAAPAHWTSQLNAPDDQPSGPFDQLLSRGSLSHGVPTTTNALILPSLPDQGAFGDRLAQSGEVIATGSIDLPRSYGATGVHPSQIDSSEVDRLFDSIEEVGTGVAPVAATSAISTQGAARTMMAPPKKEGMNVPLVLAVTAGVLALGVVGTLVIGAMSGLF